METKLIRVILAHLFFWFVWIRVVVADRCKRFWAAKGPTNTNNNSPIITNAPKSEQRVETTTAKHKDVVEASQIGVNIVDDTTQTPSGSPLTPCENKVHASALEQRAQDADPNVGAINIKEPDPQAAKITTAAQAHDARIGTSVDPGNEQRLAPSKNGDNCIGPLEKPVNTTDIDVFFPPTYVYRCVCVNGAFCGFLFGLVGTGGPPYVVMNMLLPPQDYPASLARCIFPLGQVFEVYLRYVSVHDLVNFRDGYIVYAINAVCGMVGVVSGNRAASTGYFARNPQVFQRLLFTLLASSSLVILGVFELDIVALSMLASCALVYEVENTQWWGKLFASSSQISER